MTSSITRGTQPPNTYILTERQTGGVRERDSQVESQTERERDGVRERERERKRERIREMELKREREGDRWSHREGQPGRV